jgi:hypothetical protein
MEEGYNYDELERNIEQTALAGQVGQQAQSTAAAQYYLQRQEQTLAEAQLEVETILEEVYHNLRQDVSYMQKDGNLGWKDNPNPRRRTLTDEGVERIMQLLKFYINKNTLLSNFSEDQIRVRMLEFALSLNANFFMKYELYFRQPSLEECKEILYKRLEEKKNIKMFANEFAGTKLTEEEIKNKVFSEIENRIEYELEKVRSEAKRNNLQEYELLFVQLKSVVEATHNRAWRGEERGSLRRHMNVSEILGVGSNKRDVKEAGGTFKWLKG